MPYLPEAYSTASTPERVTLSTYPLLGFLTRLLTRVRVLFLSDFEEDIVAYSPAFDFEEDIVDTNAYIVERIRRTHLLLRADKGRHYRLLLPRLSLQSIGQAAKTLDAF